MPCTHLTVPRVKQNNDMLCGAACAHMILLSLQILKIETAAQQKATQAQIWTDIQQNTGNPPPDFPVIEPCGIEWATHPLALKRTLNARIGPSSAEIIAEPDEDATAGLALTSVKLGLPAVVLVQGTAHWIVVFGCEHSRLKKFREEILAGEAVTHVLVRDPAEGGYPKRLTLDGWAVAMSSVTCGEFNNKYIVVGAR